MVLLIWGCKTSVDSIPIDAKSLIIPIETRKSIEDCTPFRTSTIIDTVEYIRLITPDDKSWIIGEITDLQYIGGKFFIHDRTIKGIFVVADNGLIENLISHPGRGPEEYLALNTFDVNPATMEISILDIASRRIQIYSENGEYIRSVQIEDIVRDMAVLPNGDFLLYTPDYMEGNRRGLWRLDSMGKFKDHHVHIDDDFLYGGLYPKYFRRINDSLIGLMGGEDYDRIYHISCDSVRVAYQLDIDIDIPSDVANDELFDFHSAEPGTLYTKNDYFEISNFLHFRVQTQNNVRTLFYDTRNRKLIKEIGKGVDVIDDYGFYGYFAFSSNDYLFTYLMVGSILEKAHDEFPDINEDSNPVLVRYKIKKALNK